MFDDDEPTNGMINNSYIGLDRTPTSSAREAEEAAGLFGDEGK